MDITIPGIENKMDISKRLLQAVQDKDLELVKLLFNLGAVLEIRDDNGFTPLCLAFSSTEITEYLLSVGVNPNGKDIRENTPLHHAVWYENRDVIRLLIKYGANITIKNQDGKTCMDISKYDFDLGYSVKNEEINRFVTELIRKRTLKLV